MTKINLGSFNPLNNSSVQTLGRALGNLKSRAVSHLPSLDMSQAVSTGLKQAGEALKMVGDGLTNLKESAYNKSDQVHDYLIKNVIGFDQHSQAPLTTGGKIAAYTLHHLGLIELSDLCSFSNDDPQINP